MKSHILAAGAAASIALAGLSPVASAAIESRDTLKTYFETGDVPTQDQFTTLIDSMANISEDGGLLNLYFTYGPSAADHTVSLHRAWLIAQTSDGNLVNFQEGQRVGPVSVEQTLINSGLLGASSRWAGQSGFLGLQFELLDGGGAVSTHYGFVQMSVDDASSATPYAIHLERFVYETTADAAITASVVPVPAAVWLLGSALGALAWLRRRIAS